MATLPDHFRGEKEVQEFMDTKIEKQMIRARNIIKAYLAFMIFIWILWLLTVFSH